MTQKNVTPLHGPLFPSRGKCASLPWWLKRVVYNASHFLTYRDVVGSRHNGAGGSGVNLRRGGGGARKLENLHLHLSPAGERLLELCVILSGSIIHTFILSK